MGEESTVQDAAGATQRFGLSLLDVTKHAVRTVIETLGARDRLTLVAFDAVARRVLDSARMDAAGKAKARAELEKLAAGQHDQPVGRARARARQAAPRRAQGRARRGRARPRPRRARSRAATAAIRAAPAPPADAAALRAPRTRAVLPSQTACRTSRPPAACARDALVRYAPSPAAAGAAGDGPTATPRARPRAPRRELAALEA